MSDYGKWIFPKLKNRTSLEISDNPEFDDMFKCKEIQLKENPENPEKEYFLLFSSVLRYGKHGPGEDIDLSNLKFTDMDGRVIEAIRDDFTIHGGPVYGVPYEQMKINRKFIMYFNIEE